MVVRCVITPGYHLQNNDYFIMKSLVLFSFVVIFYSPLILDEEDVVYSFYTLGPQC
ncbi:MAG: hypothetical protein FKGGLIKP_00163 [Sodalis sp. Fse]|nr:MAG: hypothetical protein FKGGLIKP_00163 [Sodalis sp. Fse]